MMDLLKTAALSVSAGTLILQLFKTLNTLSKEGHKCLSSNNDRPVQGTVAMVPHTFTNKQGLRLYYNWWFPASGCKNANGLVVICHGFAEHCGRYEHIAAALNRAGFVVYALDLQGHGRSEGDRCHVVRFHHYVDDLLHFAVDVAQAQQPHLKHRTFLFGKFINNLIVLTLRPTMLLVWHL